LNLPSSQQSGKPEASILGGIMRHPLIIISGYLLVMLAGLCLPCPAERLKLELKDFTKADGTATGWTTWAQREEIKPRCFVDTVNYRSAPDSLAISGNSNSAEYGGWVFPIANIKAGQYYQLTAYYRTRSVPYEQRQVVARLVWSNQLGQQVGQADYAYETSVEGEWKRLTLRVPAPPQAARVNLELRLGWAPRGRYGGTISPLRRRRRPPPGWFGLAVSPCAHKTWRTRRPVLAHFCRR
jgi:hypothetical protein